MKLSLGWIFGLVGFGYFVVLVLSLVFLFAGVVGKGVFWGVVLSLLVVALAVGVVLFLVNRRVVGDVVKVHNLSPDEGKRFIVDYFRCASFNPGHLSFNFPSHFMQVIDLARWGHDGKMLFMNALERKGVFSEEWFIVLRLDDASLFGFVKGRDVEKIDSMVNRISPVDIGEDIESIVRENALGREFIQRKRPVLEKDDEEGLSGEEDGDKGEESEAVV